MPIVVPPTNSWRDRVWKEFRAGNLTRAYRDVLRRNHPSVWFAHLVAPRDVIAARMAQRPHHYMPASLLDAQFADLEPLDASEPGATVPAAGSAAETTDALMARLGVASS